MQKRGKNTTKRKRRTGWLGCFLAGLSQKGHLVELTVGLYRDFQQQVFDFGNRAKIVGCLLIGDDFNDGVADESSFFKVNQVSEHVRVAVLQEGQITQINSCQNVEKKKSDEQSDELFVFFFGV